MKKRIAVACYSLLLFLSFAVSASAETVENKLITLNFAFGERTGYYTGEWENELPNGLGKFTTTNEINDRWTYEGEFIDGHLMGKGTTTWSNGTSESGYYADDALNPENGYVKEYENGQLVFEGYYQYGSRSSGKLYENGQLLFDGLFYDGQYHNGKYYQNNQLLYDGSFYNGTFNFNGKLYMNGKVVYDGYFDNGRFGGEGTLYENLVAVYSGNFTSGLRDGNGKEYVDGKIVYEGNFTNGERDDGGPVNPVVYKYTPPPVVIAEDDDEYTWTFWDEVEYYAPYIIPAVIAVALVIIIVVIWQRVRARANNQTVQPNYPRQIPVQNARPRPSLTSGRPPYVDPSVNRTLAKKKKIDLNTCTEQELESLPGVGVVLAKKAVAARKQRNFRSIQDFAQRIGIKQHFAVQIERLAFAQATATQKINLNTCQAEDLLCLPGIDIERAQWIVRLRVLERFDSVYDFCQRLHFNNKQAEQIEKLAFVQEKSKDVQPAQPKPGGVKPAQPVLQPEQSRRLDVQQPAQVGANQQKRRNAPPRPRRLDIQQPSTAEVQPEEAENAERVVDI